LLCASIMQMNRPGFLRSAPFLFAFLSACSGDVNEPREAAPEQPIGSGGQFAGGTGNLDGAGRGSVGGYGGSYEYVGGHGGTGSNGFAGYAGNQPELDCQASAPTNGQPALVAQYHFDEPSGAHVEDATGRALAGGTIYGATRGDGHSDGAVVFSAADARIELEHFGNVFCNGIDVEIWVQPMAIQPGEVHLVGGGGGGESFHLVLLDGYPVFQIVDGESGPWRELLRSSATVQAGTWQKLRVTYDGDVGQMFIDDLETASVSLVNPIQGSYNTVYVGGLRDYEAGDQPIINEFSGSVDELSVWRYPAN
jgi:Concanavalin A-like lectin/glucanases superfamily